MKFNKLARHFDFTKTELAKLLHSIDAFIASSSALNIFMSDKPNLSSMQSSSNVLFISILNIPNNIANILFLHDAIYSRLYLIFKNNFIIFSYNNRLKTF